MVYHFTDWTLAQAAAWIVFRDMSIVERFAPPDAEHWSAFMMYDTMRTTKTYGSVGDLHEALRSGDVLAWGRCNITDAIVEQVPTMEWPSLSISPPDAFSYSPGGRREHPWRDIRLTSEAVREHWPHPDLPKKREPSRAVVNWEVVDQTIKKLRRTLPAALSETDRSLAERLTRMIGTELNDSEIPKDRAMRKHISALRKTGDLPPRD
jgi:hypothetical protein